MPRLCTRTVSTKVTEDDYALFAQLAGDQRVGERPSQELERGQLLWFKKLSTWPR